MNVKIFISGLIILMALQSCSQRQLLTQQAIEEHHITPEFMKHIQFYNTKDIVLTRIEEGKNERSAQKGALKVEAGKEIEQVIIPAKTPGKVVSIIDKQHIAVSFEPDDSKYLVFGMDRSGTTFNLHAKVWNNGKGVVEYAGEQFVTNSGASQVGLEFKMDRKELQQQNVRFAKGNKL
ncbi:MAG: hypothetical protein WEC59_04395 [Salibacteraceae bacterium]